MRLVTVVEADTDSIHSGDNWAPTLLQLFGSSPFAILLVANRIMAPKVDSSATASAAQPGAASVAQPASSIYLPLGQLNKASVKTGGQWLVSAFRPVEDNYEYTWQGKPRQATNFVVTLVSVDDPSQYCQAQFKKKASNALKYEQVKNTMEHGRRFVMSKVAFVEDAKLAYVSCSLKIVVDLFSTKMDPCVETSGSVVQPAPTATIAGSANVEGNQFFDVTALAQEVSDVTEHANNRSSFVIKIYDGTLDPKINKIKVMPLKVYFDTTQPSGTVLALQSGNDMKALVEQHMQNKMPMSFFCISGAQDDMGKFAFRSTKHTYIAGAIGAKADKMKASAELHNLKTEETAIFEIQTTTATARDWSAEPGKETRCGLLATFVRNATGVKELDAGETIWQINWVRIVEPSADLSQQLCFLYKSVCLCVRW